MKITKYRKILTKRFLKKEYFKNKKSANLIAKELDCSSLTVAKYLKIYKISVRKYSGKSNHAFKHGESTYQHYCIDCDKEISWVSKRCLFCAHNHRRVKNKVHLCKICNRNRICYKTWKYGGSRCRFCAQKERLKNPENHSMYNKHHTKEAKRKMSEAHKNKIVSKKTRIKMSLANKKRWQNKVYRKKVLLNMLKARKLTPNKPEKALNNLLNMLLPKEYQFVGNGKIIIDRFCPDFINVNGQKKIIEMYGDYWHNLATAKKRDTRRLRVYKKYGYKTLIVWEHELKDLNRLQQKIKEFNNVYSC